MGRPIFDLSDCEEEGVHELVIRLGQAQLRTEGYRRASAYGQLVRAALRAAQREHDRLYGDAVPGWIP